MVDGKAVKYDGRRIDLDVGPARDAVAASVDYVRSKIGDQWDAGMHPEIPENETIPNPYTYRNDA